MKPDLNEERCNLLQPPTIDELTLTLPLDLNDHSLRRIVLDLRVDAVPEDLQACLEQRGDLLVLHMVPIQVAEDLPHPIDEDLVVIPCSNQGIQELCPG
jgi:hypothetical protein